MKKDIITYRFLPHYQSPGAAIFVTYRLAMTLPKHVLTALGNAKLTDEAALTGHSERIKKLRKYHQATKRFELFDDLIADTDTPRFLLTEPHIMPNIIEPLHFIDDKKIKLLCYSVMPNHVHCVFIPLNMNVDEMYPLSDIMHSLKGFSAHQLTKKLNLTSEVWNKEYWDHTVRNDKEFKYYILYTLMNPVKAKLCLAWTGWKGSWVSDELVEAVKGDLG